MLPTRWLTPRRCAASMARAYLMYRLWQKSAYGDGANFHGQAADLARNEGIGLYKFPPELLDQLPRLPPPLSFETCAVVGNSRELLEGALGEEIDAHGMIVRMNAAPIKVSLDWAAQLGQRGSAGARGRA